MNIAELIGEALGEENDRGNQNSPGPAERSVPINFQARQMTVNTPEIRIVIQDTENSFGSNMSESAFALSRQERMIRDDMTTPDGNGFVLLDEPMLSEG